MTPVRVFHLQRKPGPDHQSIEGLFGGLRQACPEDIQPVRWVAPEMSRGLRPRLQIVRSGRALSRSQPRAIFHVTGDIQFACLGLPPRQTLLTIHDCEMLDRISGLARWVLNWFWFRLPIQRATIITTISEASCSDIVRRFPSARRKIRIIHDPVDPEFVASASPFHPQEPTRLLQIGTKHNKNLLRTAEALRGLACRITIIGHLDESQRKALFSNGISYENRHSLTKNQLIEEYQNADLVLLPSTKEGFGLPIVEAQAIGRPVVTSNLSSMPEVAGGAAELVDPLSPESIRAGVRRVIEEPGYAQRLVEKGRKNLQRFRIEVIAEQYASAYREVAASAYYTATHEEL